MKIHHVLVIAGMAAIAILGVVMTGESPSDTRTIDTDNPSPVIDLNDILTNPQMVEESNAAVLSGDMEVLLSLQAKALEIADAGGIAEQDRRAIEGPRGLDYMTFLAKRRLFVEAFEDRFRNLQPITSLKLTYPEASDLFEKADQLIDTRDKTIVSIAEMLADGAPTSEYMAQAREAWRQRAAQDASPVL